MFRWLLLFFIVTPIVEMYLLLTVGDIIGALPTIALVLLTAVIGVTLLRRQGLATLGAEVEELDAGDRAPIDPAAVEARLRADRDGRIKAVLATHNETATGVKSDIAAIRHAMDAVEHPAMLFVDGVSSIASIDFRYLE